MGASGDTSPCRMTRVTLYRVTSLRSSYTGLYPQRVRLLFRGPRGLPTVQKKQAGGRATPGSLSLSLFLSLPLSLPASLSLPLSPSLFLPPSLSFPLSPFLLPKQPQAARRLISGDFSYKPPRNGKTGKPQSKVNRFAESMLAAVKSRVKSIGGVSGQLDASKASGGHGVVEGYSSQFENNHFTEMCSSSKAGSYFRLVYHSTPGLKVIMKR